MACDDGGRSTAAPVRRRRRRRPSSSRRSKPRADHADSPDPPRYPQRVVGPGRCRPGTSQHADGLPPLRREVSQSGPRHEHLGRLSARELRLYLDYLKRRGTGVRSIRYVHATLRAALEDAMREELIEKNVAKLVRPPTAPSSSPIRCRSKRRRRSSRATATTDSSRCSS